MVIDNCFIALDIDGKMYTDYDLYIPEKISKRRMVGNMGSVFEYKQSKLLDIARDSKRITLLNPTELCSVHTIAYEIAIDMIKDVKKLEILATTSNPVSFKYNMPPFATKLSDEYRFNKLKELLSDPYRRSMNIEAIRWARAFLYSNYRIWHNCSDKDYLMDGYISLGQISELNKDCIGDIPKSKFNTLVMWIKKNTEESVMDIFERFNGDISPIESRPQPLAGRNAIEVTFIVDKKLGLKDVKNILDKYGSLVDGTIFYS